MSSFSVNIDEFEGPLDLMLFLIKSNKLDLFDLDMNILTTQYVNYITTMKNLNVEVASEYLSELASLIEYKSKKLLPKEVVEITEEYQEDERDKLVARLIEYQNYKEASLKLEEAYLSRQELHSKPLSEETQNWINEGSEIIQGNPYELMKAMQRIIKRQSMIKPNVGILSLKEVSLEERSAQIQLFFQKNKKCSFEELCNDCVNIHMVVVSFLVVLEMMKTQKIFVSLVDDKMIIERKEYE